MDAELVLDGLRGQADLPTDALLPFGFQVPVPGVSQERIFQVIEQLKQQGGPGGGLGNFLGVFGMLSAGGLLSFGIFSLGIMPYISSSIIFSILGKVVPSIEKMVKEGSQGQKRLNQWMRWGTVPICLIQAIFLINCQYEFRLLGTQEMCSSHIVWI